MWYITNGVIVVGKYLSEKETSKVWSATTNTIIRVQMKGYFK